MSNTNNQGGMGLAGLVIFLAFVAAVVGYFRMGYLGISDWAGPWWAWAAVVVAFFGFVPPIVVGVFLCALNVWHWHWFFALLIAAPPLAFVLPGYALILISTVFDMAKNAVTPKRAAADDSRAEIVEVKAETALGGESVKPQPTGGMPWVIFVFVILTFGSTGALFGNLVEDDRVIKENTEKLTAQLKFARGNSYNTSYPLDVRAKLAQEAIELEKALVITDEVKAVKPTLYALAAGQAGLMLLTIIFFGHLEQPQKNSNKAHSNWIEPHHAF